MAAFFRGKHIRKYHERITVQTGMQNQYIGYLKKTDVRTSIVDVDVSFHHVRAIQPVNGGNGEGMMTDEAIN